MMAKTWQVRFLLNGRERVERIPAPTRYDAAEYIRCKYSFIPTYTRKVVVYDVRDVQEVSQ